jgi:chromosome segregation ATPase/cytoskeletal protein CcmA (bactofilin family)
MTTANSKPAKAGILSRAGAYLSGRRNWHDIPGYHVGEVFSDVPVSVAATAAVAGDIIAPKVVVNGLVYGCIVAWEVAVMEEGQVWGDIHAAHLTVVAGGKVQGWTSTLTEENYQALLSGQITLDGLPRTGQPALLADLETRGLTSLLSDQTFSQPENRLELLRRLQAEAGAALAARAELEQQFESRVADAAGQAMAEATSLRQELAADQDQLSGLQTRLEEIEATLQLAEQQAAVQADELSTTCRQLEQQTQLVSELQTALAEQATLLENQESANQRLTRQISQSMGHHESAASRIENLETALQGSLQRAADLEESLLRWQELADVTEKRVNELQEQLEKSAFQLEESSRVTEILRAQRERLQEAWDRTSTELNEWQNRVTDLEQTVAESHEELAFLRDQLTHRPPLDQQAEAEMQTLKISLTSAEAQVSELEKRVERAEAEVQEYFDQILWYKASLKTTSLELEETQQQADIQAKELERLNGEIVEKQAQVDKWKTNIGRMTEMLYEAERRFKEMQAEVEAVQGQRSDETVKLRESLRQRELQMEANEREIDRYHQEFQAQSGRLAETQALLIEREVEANRARATVATHLQEINKIKQLAGKRIRDLEAEVEQTRQQLKDLTTLLDRRKRREAGE